MFNCCFKEKVLKKTKLSFDVSKETVNCTNLSQLKIGDLINIEKSLRVGDEISGHFVFGHVDDTAELVSRKKLVALMSWNSESQNRWENLMQKKVQLQLMVFL